MARDNYGNRLTKKAICIQMISRKGGATLDEMAQAIKDAGIDDDLRVNRTTANLWMSKLTDERGNRILVVHDKGTGKYSRRTSTEVASNAPAPVALQAPATLQAQSVMNENDVIQRMKQELEARGYTVDSVASTHETGNDMEAHRNGKRLIVEAKGATSSKPGTKDFGKPWDKAKLSHSLAQAILRAMETIADHETVNEAVVVAIALPDVPYYRRTVKRIQGSLAASKIKAYLVSANAVEVL